MRIFAKCNLKRGFVMKKLCILLILVSFCYLTHAAEAIPFVCSFEKESDLENWETYNRDDDEECWFHGKADMGGWGAQSLASANNAPTDNWLVSPAIHFNEGGRYQLSFMVYTAYYCVEKMQVTIGAQPEPESQVTVLQDITIPQVKGYYGYKVSILLSDINEGDYHIGLRYYTDATNTMLVTVRDFSVSAITNGNIAGVVKSNDGKPLQGVKISIDGMVSRETVSDENGCYAFDEIPQGDYNLSAEKFGYNKIANRIITVAPEVTADGNITMYEMTQVAFSGTVKDVNGNPVSGASVCIKGYADYRTFTDADGKYMFEKVYVDGYSSQYSVDVKKNNFEKQTATAYIYGYGENTKDFMLRYMNLPPFSVKAEVSDGNTARLQWQQPVDLTELMYDNGEPLSPLGFTDGHDDANILGVIFREPMTLHKLKWYTIDIEGRSPYVNIFIMGLDSEGAPTGEILYSKERVVSDSEMWTSFTLEEPLFCPDGFMVAFSGNGNISLAKDTNPEIVGGKRQLFSNFITSPDAYRYFEDVNWTGALMVHAEGELYQLPPFSPEINYDVFRLLEQDKDDVSKWQKIGEGESGTELLDNSFSDLPRGDYYYAVTANYPAGGFTSEATLSNLIFKRQYASVVVRVSTNSVAEDAVGAIVKLKDPDGLSYTATVGSDNVASFDGIWRSKYELSIAQPGFRHESQMVDFSDKDVYEREEHLVQILAPVTNIDIVDTDNGSEKELLWNLFADIEDDFEDEGAYNDFEINPSGKIGWQYVDNDGFTTYSFSATTFPGMGSPMAAIIMNGNTTEPPVSTNISHSGSRELAFFACRAAELGGADDDGNDELIARPSDDYLISPRLTFHKDFTFSFFARTYQSQEDRLESFRVGYSTTDASLGSFTYVTDGYVNVPENPEYTRYEYAIPKEAKYVTLNSRSDDVFMLLVDDIKLSTGIRHSGEPHSYGDFIGYNVYLDGELLETRQDNRCLLDVSGLEVGEHNASVSKVYRSGESEALSVPFSITTNSIDGIVVNPIEIYSAARTLYIKGAYQEAAIYDISGVLLKAWAAPAEMTDVSDIARGIYIVKVMDTSGKITTAKILIK